MPIDCCSGQTAGGRHLPCSMMGIMGEISEDVVPGSRERLRHVYWVGGASGAGKSTIARRLADGQGPA